MVDFDMVDELVTYEICRVRKSSENGEEFLSIGREIPTLSSDALHLHTREWS